MSVGTDRMALRIGDAQQERLDRPSPPIDVFLLDIDHSREIPAIAADVDAALHLFHARNAQFFEWAITSYLRETMQPEPKT